MSYNQKPPGPSGSGMGGGPPNGPNNIPQVAKTFAGIQQQMQNLVHGQNAIPQSSQADINAFLQQQRIQNMLKQQQQFLQFQHQMQAQQQQQQQQHQQQQQQLHNMPGGGNVGAGPVVGPAGVGAGGAGSGGAGGSGEPLALTRTPGAAELLNKTYQQQANGNPAANPTFNQLQQTLQALPTNFVQQLQAFQYQMQAKQMQQQQHHGGGGQGHQGGHGQQQQPVQGVPPPPPPTTSAMSHQQQQHQQKHQQHQQQQNAAALSTVAAVQQLQQRYLTAAAAAVSGNKISSATPPPPPPPLTNQMKPPNLPPNTQITPVSGPNVGSNNLSGSASSAGGGPHQKLSTGNTNSGSAKHQAPPPPAPSISLTPSKQNASTPSVAHQQNKFMPPSHSAGGKGGHLGHSQNLSKSTHGGQTTTTSNTTSPAKTSTGNADAVVAATAVASALKSPQSTPVQLTKQTTAVASTVGNKTGGNKTAGNTSAGTTAAAMVSPQKSTTATTTVTPSASNTNTTITTTANAANSTNSHAKQNITKPTTEDLVATTKPPTKSLVTEKELPKLPIKDGTKKPTDVSTPVSLCTENNKKDTEKIAKENKLETAITPKTSLPVSSTLNQPTEKACNEVAIKAIKTAITATATAAAATTSAVQIEPKVTLTTGENKLDAVVNLNKPENHSVDPIKAEADKKSIDAKKVQEKIKPSITGEKPTIPLNATSQQETSKKPETLADDKKSVNQAKKSNDEIKIDKKDETTEIEKKPKSTKTSKIEEENTITKDTPPKLEKETEKLNTTVEKSSAIAVKSTEKVDLNVKNTLDILPKNDKKEPLKTAAIPQKKEEEKVTSIILNAEKDKSIESVDSLKADAIKEMAVKDNEEPPKHNKTNEKSESTIPVKSAMATKTNTEDSVRENTDSAQKETATAVAVATPPVKKLGRLSKGAKSKTATVAPPATVAAAVAGASITPEKQLDEKPLAAVAATSAVRIKRKSKTESSSYVFDSAPSTPRDDDLDRKSKRHRLKTILYQSPLPELAYITKLSASEASNSPKPMSNEDRLIVFYKNEYMAVRNSEGTFYLCQTMQNVYRTSPRISIRWLSEDAKDNNVYMPDFYDHTDIECVLTTVELKRIDKGHLRLPKTERVRIENILKKAIDVEKGIVPRPDLTEENPDGLDISLYKDESQIEKKSSADSGGIESGTPSSKTGRKSRKGHAVTASASRKSTAAATPSTSSIGNKRKRGASSAAASTSKSPAKKRKTLLKRKKKMMIDLSDDEDDDETSDDSESDMEYKPTQKRSSLNTSATGSKTTPRAQRSPLAKARAASPITPTTSRSKNVPQKTTPTPSTSKVSRGERAAKRKSITDAGSSEENPTPVKKPMTSSTSTNNGKTTNTNNKNKVASKISNSNATTTLIAVKKSLIDSKASDSTNTNTTTTITATATSNTSSTITNTSQAASATNSPKSGNNGGEDNISGGSGGGVGVDSNVNRPARSRK